MSKRAAIHRAIATQLAAEGKPPIELRGTLGQSQNLPALNTDASGLYAGTFIRGGGYDENSVRTFLANVALRLRDDRPSLLFKWSSLTDRLLTDPLWLIEDRIAQNTMLQEEITR